MIFRGWIKFIHACRQSTIIWSYCYINNYFFSNKGFNWLFERFSLKLTSSQESHRDKVKPVKFFILTSHIVKICYIINLDYWRNLIGTTLVKYEPWVFWSFYLKFYFWFEYSTNRLCDHRGSQYDVRKLLVKSK